MTSPTPAPLRYPDWTVPVGCTCTVTSRDDVPGYDRWLLLNLTPTCRVHQLPDGLAEGVRFQLVHLGPDPVDGALPDGATGVIDDLVPAGDGTVHANVTWDHGPGLNLSLPADVITVIS